jgi:hypothetical protein
MVSVIISTIKFKFSGIYLKIAFTLAAKPSSILKSVSVHTYTSCFTPSDVAGKVNVEKKKLPDPGQSMR